MWHGSVTPGITLFNPGTHFGGRIQALIAIVAAQALEGKQGQPTLYFCRLNVQSGQIFTLRDWGSPSLQALLHHYMKENGDGDRYARKYYPELSRKDCPSEERSAIFLADETKPRGHVAIVYRNEVEFVSEDSLCVIDPHRVVVVQEFHPSEDDIREGLSGVSRGDVGYSDVEWAKILFRLGRSV